MVRLFIIWNRSYRQQFVLAEDVEAALNLSVRSKHIRRASAYRRYAVVSDEDLQQLDDADSAMALLKAGAPGVIRRTPGKGWELIT